MTHQVKVSLKTEDQDKFTAVKEFIGVQADAEVFRVLLNEKYRELKKEKI